jgi:hypothetical protein
MEENLQIAKLLIDAIQDGKSTQSLSARITDSIEIMIESPPKATRSTLSSRWLVIMTLLLKNVRKLVQIIGKRREL